MTERIILKFKMILTTNTVMPHCPVTWESRLHWAVQPLPQPPTDGEATTWCNRREHQHPWWWRSCLPPSVVFPCWLGWSLPRGTAPFPYMDDRHQPKHVEGDGSRRLRDVNKKGRATPGRGGELYVGIKLCWMYRDWFDHLIEKESPSNHEATL